MQSMGSQSQTRLSDCTSVQGYLPNPGIKLVSLTSSALAGGFFITNATGKISGAVWRQGLEVH